MNFQKGPLKCIFVGDLALGDHPKSVGFGFYSKYSGGISENKAASLFPPGYEHDLLFGNLEFTLGGTILNGSSHEELNCRGIKCYADFLQKAGFNAVNIANNHIYQHGIDAFEKTLATLTDKGIRIVGLWEDCDDSSNVVKFADRSICLLGWSVRPRQGFTDKPPYREFDESSSCKEIAEARKHHPYVFVSLHWGDEFIEIPSDEEKRVARRLIDAGANVVVGHHPHVVREVEEYNGGLIAYSLGNFICDMIWNEKTRKTGFLYVELSDNKIARWEMVHGRIDDSYFPDFSTAPDNPAEKFKKLNSKLEKSSYDIMALQALKHHQFLTVLHMIRNCRKYSPGVWLSMLGNAIKSRIAIKF